MSTSSTDNMKGVLAVFKRNPKKRYFLASSKNFFGNLQVEAVMLDSGCNGILLPLKIGQLYDLLKIFPKENQFEWKIGESTGVSGSSLALIIVSLSPSGILISFAKDLLPNNLPIIVKSIRFHLCSEDTQTLAEEVMLFEYLSSNAHRQRVTTFLANSKTSIKRREHALVGQGVIRESSVIQHGSISLIVNPQSFEPIPFWVNVARIESIIRDQANLPDKFDTLEDEDHEGDDDEEDFDIEIEDDLMLD